MVEINPFSKKWFSITIDYDWESTYSLPLAYANIGDFKSHKSKIGFKQQDEEETEEERMLRFFGTPSREWRG